MCFGINEATGIIQLMKLPSNDNIYIDSHSNAVGSIWQKHRESVVRIMKRCAPECVFEIGGGGGFLEHTYNVADGSKTKKWIILEPQPNPINTSAEYIQGFFPFLI